MLLFATPRAIRHRARTERTGRHLATSIPGIPFLPRDREEWQKGMLRIVSY
jgi:hypothetical protein